MNAAPPYCRLEDGWDVEPESAAMGDLQALRDEIEALKAALAIKDAALATKGAALAAASGKIALLETENRALRGDSGDGWSLTSGGPRGGRLAPA